jgi:hypothetical protein
MPIRTVLTRTPIPDEEKRASGSLLAALAPFFELRGDMPAQYIKTFLLVAMDEGHGVGEYARRAGVSKSVMSRHILDLGMRLRTGEPGLDLLMTRPNPMELRRHEVFLTAAGRTLAHRILQNWRLTAGQ